MTYLGIDLDPRWRPHVLADAHALPVRSGSVDMVLMSEVLEHLEAPQHALEEAVRALKPGGTLIVTVPFVYRVHEDPADYWRWTPAGIRLGLAAMVRSGILGSPEVLPKGGIALTLAALLADLPQMIVDVAPAGPPGGLVRAIALALRLLLIPLGASLCTVDAVLPLGTAWAPGFIVVVRKAEDDAADRGPTDQAHEEATMPCLWYGDEFTRDEDGGESPPSAAGESQPRVNALWRPKSEGIAVDAS